MIKTGIDITEIKRFSEMKNAERFLQKNFTGREREYFSSWKNPYPHIAAAFAAKEAFSKYLGSGMRGVGFSDIELLHNNLGKPYILFKGEAVCADVSISHTDTTAVAVVCGDDMCMRNEDYSEIRKLLPVRRADMHKGDCGRVFILAGSLGMSGAACMCSKAAMRCGSGLVTLGVPDCIQPVAAAYTPEVMTLPLMSRNGMISLESTNEICKSAAATDACAIGSGLGKPDGLEKLIKEILNGTTPCIIDADGLNAVAKCTDMLRDKRCEVVITPHPGEMSRLCGIPIEEVNARRTEAAALFAKEYNCTVVLKGHETVIASPDGRTAVNTTGNSGMASGGMGDVLTGVIASFAGQGCSVYDAAVLGVFLHGLAADLAVADTGEFGLIASDVIDFLPKAIKMIMKNEK